MALETIPAEAVGLRLCRVDRSERLHLCEGIRFEAGRSALVSTLLRARISGLVDPDGDLQNYWADVLDGEGDMISTVALDRRSYAALKNRWMRCRIESFGASHD